LAVVRLEPRRDRLYYFDTPAGLVDLMTSIDFMYTSVELNGIPANPRTGELAIPGVLELRRADPTYVSLPEVLLSGSIGRGKIMSPSIMIREYFRKRRAGDYGYKLYAMWRLLCRTAGYKVPTYDYFRLLLYRLKRLQLIRPTNPTPPHMWKAGTESSQIPRVVANKTMFAVTRFGLSTYPYLGADSTGEVVQLDAIDRMWHDVQMALYDPSREQRQAAARFLPAEDIARIGWP
jgi:hypothetical protein